MRIPVEGVVTQDHFPKTLCFNLQLNNELYNLAVIGDVIMPLSRVNIKQNQVLFFMHDYHITFYPGPQLDQGPLAA
jgi:hypothetical protein